MRLYKVELGGFEPWLGADDGDLGPLRQSWTQQPGHWTLFMFEHDGIMSVNNKPIPFKKGNLGFIVPGTKVSFARIGEGTRFKGMTFGLLRRTETVTLPAVADLGTMAEIRRR